ncbi:MAG TPA: Smr/MutS family protein [Sphingobium sp.]|nr:Smr/MutS family protein [Sphingobium sp.]
MPRRHLSPEDQALWSALIRSVRPLRPGAPGPDPQRPPVAPIPVTGLMKTPIPQAPSAPPRTPATVLDSSWERRIRNGTLAPEMSIDLHGHSLAAAHVRLNQALAAALARDVRTLLVVTGKPPKNAGMARDSRRGAIRGEIGHWLETSAYADRIASVRLAHPRHGGEGALYVILRRKK